MRFRLFKKFFFLPAFVIFLALSVSAKTDIPFNDAAKSLPDKLSTFAARGPAMLPTVGVLEGYSAENFGALSHAVRKYVATNDAIFLVTAVKTQSASGAYSLLTHYGGGTQEIHLGTIGTANIVDSRGVAFFKGRWFATVIPADKSIGTQDQARSLAAALAEIQEAEDNDVPILVKHLPDWATAAPRAYYAVSLAGLNQAIHNQVFTPDLSFEGGTEAVAAYYGSTLLVVVEFNTPQLAGDNDLRITGKIQELRNQGQATPSAYRRVGNYSVFVFNAPNEAAANQLIDQVKYQQVVQWLGDNPYLYEQATREFTETTLGVFVAVVKASGLALVTCFAIGGFFGALLFSYRRAQKRKQEAFSDAGGMLRLNLDELTPQTDPARLIGRGE